MSMKIVLTGYYWDEQDSVPGKGTIVEVDEDAASAGWWFSWNGTDRWWASSDQDHGWGAKLVEESLPVRLTEGEEAGYFSTLEELRNDYDEYVTRQQVVVVLRDLADEIERGSMREEA